jgi:hypothetical protein
MIDFNDLNDLDDVRLNVGQLDKLAERLGVPTDITQVKALPAVHPYIEKCPKCMGTGRYRGYSIHGSTCFKCGGTGKLEFATSPEQRAKSRAASRKAKERKQNAVAEKFAAFCAAHPDIVRWWTGSNFDFAISLRETAEKFGELTERQLAAAKSCVAKLAAAKAEREAKAPAVAVSNIKESLIRATEKGIRTPKILLAGEHHAFVFSLAKAQSVNAGAVYVKHKATGDYLGKIVNGRFLGTRDCTAEQTAEIVAVTADPAQSAIAYGKRFGVCSCCGRELTNGESIDRGIGPICFEKYFGM